MYFRHGCLSTLISQTVRFSCVWAFCVCLASMSQLEQPVVYYLRFVWVTKATVHTHLQEKRPAVTSRDDHSKADLSCLLTAHQRNVDVTLLWFFQGLLAQAWLSSNQECDQVDSKVDPITHSNHIMGGKWEKGTSCHTSIYVLGFFVMPFPSKTYSVFI